MGEISHLTKIAIQEIRDEVTEDRDRVLQSVQAFFNLNGEVVDRTIFIANRKWRVKAVRQMHEVLGTDVGAVSATVRKATGTQGPAAGVLVLSSATEFNLKSTINTVVAGVLTTTAADLELAVGDRLTADFTGVITAVAGVVIEIDLIPI